MDEKFDRAKNHSLLGNQLKGLQNTFKSVISKGELREAFSRLLGHEVTEAQSVKSFHDYYEIARKIKKAEEQFILHHHPPELIEPTIVPYEASRWTSDVEFGRQQLNGTNFVLIRRCTTLPDNFPVTNDLVNHLLCRRLTLDQEIQVWPMTYLLVGIKVVLSISQYHNTVEVA